MHIFTTILILAITSRVLGQLMSYLRQPAITGEILAGILLGPAILNYIQPSEALSGITKLAVFLIVFKSGLELHLNEIIQVVRGKAFFFSLLCFTLPMIGGLGVGIAFALPMSGSVFLGLVLALTALPVAIRMLEGLKLIETRVGHSTMGAAIFIDLICLLALGVVLDRRDTSSLRAILTTVAVTGGKMIFFASLILGIEYLFRLEVEHTRKVRLLIESTMSRLGPEAIFGIAVFFVLFFSSVSESLGFHFVIGAVFGGLLLNQEVLGIKAFKSVETTLHSFADGFLSPLFFASLGLNFSLSSITQPWLIISLLVVAFGAKLLAGTFGSSLLNFTWREGATVGLILNSRGVMDLVVAQVALDYGFIGQELFSGLIIVAMFSTLGIPLVARWLVPDSGGRLAKQVNRP